MVNSNFIELSNNFKGFRLIERTTNNRYSCVLDGGEFYRKYKKDTMMFGHKCVAWNTCHGGAVAKQPHFVTGITVNKSGNSYNVSIKPIYKHNSYPYRFTCNSIKDIIDTINNEWLYKEVPIYVKKSYEKHSGDNALNHNMDNPRRINIFEMSVFYGNWITNFSENSGWYPEWVNWRSRNNIKAPIPEKFILNPY